MKKIFVLGVAISSIVLLLWVEQGLVVSYAVKTVAKAILFLGIPVLLWRKRGFPYLQFHKVDRKSLSGSLTIGIIVMALIMTAFIFLQSFIDIDSLLNSLEAIGVTSVLFPFVAFYILFGNSLLEEFFFRGLIPDFFNHRISRLLIPSLLFAIYHIAIFLTWFSLPILLLAICGLWIGGVIFQLVNERSRTIFPSWIIHMFADVGVLLIGVYIFYIY